MGARINDGMRRTYLEVYVTSLKQMCGIQTMMWA